MQLIKIIYKVVENPKSSKNYYELKDYFTQNNMSQFAEAFAHLIEKKYAPIHSNNSEQDRPE
jgi:hypothetical protein